MDVRELAIYRRVSRTNYSRRFSEASTERAYQKRGISLASRMEIGYVAKDAKRRGGEHERTVEEFDVGYYRKLLEKAWDVVSFVSKRNN